MAKKLKPLLQSLQAASEIINKESDSLMDAIYRVENAIGRLNIGVGLWLDTPIDETFDQETGFHEIVKLGYWRDDETKVWNLYVGYYRDNEQLKVVQLSKAARDDKLHALEHLEELLEVLLQRAQEKVAKIQAAKEMTDQISEELGDEPPF